MPVRPHRWAVAATLLLVAASPAGVAAQEQPPTSSLAVTSTSDPTSPASADDTAVTDAAEPSSTEVGPTAVAGPTCTTVAHVGDSTTVMMRDALRAAYAQAGWVSSVIDAGGGRGVFHSVSPDVTGLRAIARIKATGFDGCWVVVLGINDVLNIDSGDRHTVEQTVRAVLDAIGPSPVLWATVHLPRHVATAARLNAAIAADGRALVLDWDSIVAADPSLQLPDLVHYTTAGSRAFATGLATASLGLQGRPVPAAPLPVAPIPVAAASTVDRSLARASFRYGSRHSEVTRLQRALRQAGFEVGTAEAGRFGPRTYLAVLAFNRDQRLPARGIVSATTATALGLPHS
jgi:hypothetical protein